MGCECWNRTTSMPALELTAQKAAAEPGDEARPARQRPIEIRIDRDRAEGIRLLHRPFVAGTLERIVIEGSDLGFIHAFGREPIWNVNIAEPLDVGKNLVRPGPTHRAGGFEG